MGSSFAADVVRRYRQYIIVLRETVSSYTLSSLIGGDRHDQLRNGLISICAELRFLGDNSITVRVDPAPGFVAMVNDPALAKHGIQLEFGQVKSVNNNLEAEHATTELGIELLQLSPEGCPVWKVTLALAIGNSRIRRDDLSAREVWTQRPNHC